MKMSLENLSNDPSLRVGNKRRAAFSIFTATAAAIALAACTPQPSSDTAPKASTFAAPAPSPSVTPETKPAGPVEQTLEANAFAKAEAQKTAEQLAARVLNEYDKHKSSLNFTQEPTSDEANSGVLPAVNVLYDTKTLLGGEFGEYGLIASVGRDAVGNFDPSTVNTVAIFENINLDGQFGTNGPSKRTNIYDFFMTKDNSTGNWYIHATNTDKNGVEPEVKLDTSVLSANQYSQPATSGEIVSLATQANQAFDLAEQEAPVNYIPATY